MKPSRPKNLDLFTLRFPIPAIVSILHRISGVVLFFLVPVVLWMLHYSLTQEGFASLQRCLTTFSIKLIIWLLLIPFCYHLLAGIRHLLMDIQLGSSLKSGRRSAQFTLIIAAVVVTLIGVWLW